jgi:phosphoenolpyruvate carboxylase
LTLARLDIRQEADRHTEALGAITAQRGLGSYATWDEDRRMAFLPASCEAETSGCRIRRAPAKVRDVIETFGDRGAPSRIARRLRHHHGQPGIDVLAVLLLQQMAGVARPLRVVPLFETSADLENAGAGTPTRCSAWTGIASAIGGGRK